MRLIHKEMVETAVADHDCSGTGDHRSAGWLRHVALGNWRREAIGTGFTLDEKREIHRRYQEYLARPERGMLKVRITSRGYTETGAVWQGSFSGFAE